MKFKEYINEDTIEYSKKLGDELSTEIINTIDKTISKFMKKRVYDVNSRQSFNKQTGVSDPLIQSDIVLAVAMEGLYNYAQGAHKHSKKILSKVK